MKTKPDKQLVQYCEVLMVLSAFSATSFGISNILTICYELGKDASDTFIWFALVQGIKAYTMFFIAALIYFLARTERIGLYFRQPAHPACHWRLDRYFRRAYQCYYQLFSP